MTRTTVMAGFVPAIAANTAAATDGRDKPGHDVSRYVSGHAVGKYPS